MLTKRMLKIARSLVREILAESKWEPPTSDRKEWRRERSDGTYEYRDTPPGEGEAPKQDEPAKMKLLGEHVGDGFYKVKDSKSFGDLVKKCSASNKNGSSVEVKEEYPADWQMFTSGDQSATVAVKPDGDIVSVAKAADSQERRWGERAIRIAAQHGGKKLDCFDTKLPHMYSKGGMRVVARMKFNDKFAPPGWDYDAYKEYNNGRPDVVFMVYDGEKKEYNPKDSIEVGSYEQGQFAQEEFLKRIKVPESKAASMNKRAKDEKPKPKDEAAKGKYVPDEGEEVLIAELMKRFGWDREKAVEEVRLM